MEGEPGAQIGGQLFLIFILILLNAYFAAAEMAMVSVDRKDILDKAENGNKKAKILLDLLKEPSKFLSTIQIGITLAGFFSAATAARNLSHVFGGFISKLGIPFGNDIAFVGITVFLAYITIVFGELIPKRIGLINAEKYAMFAVRGINIIYKFLSPFVRLLSFTTNTVLRILGYKDEGMEQKITLEEIKSMVEVGHEQGIINPTERDMIDSVIGFDNQLAEEIMTARTEIFMIDVDDPIEEYLDDMLTLKHSRIPVCEEDADNIIGVLYIKDFLLEAYKVGFNKVDIKKILRPAYFIPERKNINELFNELQEGRMHMAILIDEYGGFSGIVTMEDLLEEIVGDIDDEYDHDEPDIRVIDKKSYRVKGATSIKEINSNLDTEFDEDSEDYDTLGGMLIHMLGYIPEDGDQKLIELEDVEFHIDEISEKRIQQVRVVLKEEEFDSNKDNMDSEES